MKMSKLVVFFAAVGALVFAANAVSGVVGPRVPAPAAKKAETVVLKKENTIVLNGEVDGASAAAVINKAKELDAALDQGLSAKWNGTKSPIYLFLYTPGGSIQSGFELIEALKGIGRPVHTVILFAASMGWQIAQSLDDRLILRNGALMSHRAHGEFTGDFGGQSPSQLDNRYALWKSRTDEMDQITVARTKGKQTMESYQKQYSSEMWITGTQSVEQGYADSVVTVKCDVNLTGVTTHELQIFGIKITYDLDNCPLNTAPMNIQISMSTTLGIMSTDQFEKNGGVYGPACLTALASDPKKLCALDTSITPTSIQDIKKKFVNQFEDKAHKPVMYW